MKVILMRKTLLAYILLSATLLLSAKNTDAENGTVQGNSRHPLAFSGCSGGMMVNVGYGFSGTYRLYDSGGVPLGYFHHRGAPVGMGGAARIHFGKHLRLGGEGYVSTMRYAGHAGYAQIGWGGITLDSQWEIRRWTLFAGGMAGGGSHKNLDVINDEVDDEFQVSRSSYRYYPFMAVAPYLGAEFALSRKVHIVAKVDYVVNVTARRPDFVSGPRFFVGFMFYHHY